MQRSVQLFWVTVIALSTTWILLLLFFSSSGYLSKGCNCPQLAATLQASLTSSGNGAENLATSSALSGHNERINALGRFSVLASGEGGNLTRPNQNNVRKPQGRGVMPFQIKGGNVSKLVIAPTLNPSPQLTRGRSVQTSPNKLILAYKFETWLLKGFESYKGCGVDACVLTNDTQLHRNADAVLFHICKLSETTPPFEKSPGQVFVAFCLEPPFSFASKAYKSRAWKSVFNWTITYRKDSDIYRPYGEVVYRGVRKGKNYTAIVSQKTRTAVWFVSNCRTQSRREAYVRELQKYIQVDIYGRCGPFKCPKYNNSACLQQIQSNYRFYLSFENSFCVDYVTEKIFKIYSQNLIPVVRGAVNYKEILPEGTYIDAADFGSPAELAAFLKRLEANATEYEAMLKRKDRYRPSYPHRVAVCKLCKMLHERKDRQVYSDFPRWINEGTCRRATDVKGLT